MKKILSLVIAAAAAFTMSSTVLAESSSETPTFTFDTDACYSYIHTFGNAADTNLTFEVTDSGAVSGRCLKISESFTGNVSNQYGGIYFDAAELGLDNFAGCTMTVNIKTNTASAKATPVLQVFSDGAQWIAESVSTGDTGKWVKGSVTVPVDRLNSKMGISIPITSEFTGDVALIDDVVITDNYGNVVANVGDIDTSLAEAPSTLSTVFTVLVFVLLVVIVIGGGAFVVIKLKRRYR